MDIVFFFIQVHNSRLKCLTVLYNNTVRSNATMIAEVKKIMQFSTEQVTPHSILGNSLHNMKQVGKRAGLRLATPLLSACVSVLSEWGELEAAEGTGKAVVTSTTTQTHGTTSLWRHGCVSPYLTGKQHLRNTSPSWSHLHDSGFLGFLIVAASRMMMKIQVTPSTKKSRLFNRIPVLLARTSFRSVFRYALLLVHDNATKFSYGRNRFWPSELKCAVVTVHWSLSGWHYPVT